MTYLSILRSTAAALCTTLLVATSYAEPYPSRPIRIVVGYTAGGGADTTARVYAEKLQTILNTPVIVENKPGAFEQLAAQTVLSAPPDGHTLWLGTAGALTIGPGVRSDIPYDILKSFTHIAKVGEVEAVLSVKNTLPVNSLADFISYAKANPNKLFYGSAGVGSGGHLLTEYIMNVTDIKLTHVPFKGDVEVVRELAAGTIDFGVPISAQAVPFVNDRRVKAIAVTGTQRLKTLPNVPTAGDSVEALKSIGIYSIYGLLGPAGMPPSTTRILNDALNKAAQMPEVIQRLETANVKATTSTPAGLQEYLGAEVAKWRELGKKLKINFN